MSTVNKASLLTDKDVVVSVFFTTDIIPGYVSGRYCNRYCVTRSGFIIS